MPDPKFNGEDLVVGFSDRAKAAIEADPTLASMVKDLTARFRQAQQSFHEGKYASFEEALAALGVKATQITEEGGE